MDNSKIPILEEFKSIQGEGVNLGKPYYFIRVGGCPLRCNFCDTEYSWTANSSQLKDIDDVIKKAMDECVKYKIQWISITGGEPLLYKKQVHKMLIEFRDHGMLTHVETSGRFFDEKILGACSIYSPDAKTPCTGEMTENFFKGIEYIRPQDQVKCLIHTEQDLDYAYQLNCRLEGICPIILQPFNDQIYTQSIKLMDEEMAHDRPADPVDITRLRRAMLTKYQWLVDLFYQRADKGQFWRNVMISPQIHALVYGNVGNR